MKPYERLLGDALRGDRTLFGSEAGVEAVLADRRSDSEQRSAGARVRARQPWTRRSRPDGRRGGRLGRTERGLCGLMQEDVATRHGEMTINAEHAEHAD